MCEVLKVTRVNGFSEATVNFDKNYVLEQTCNQLGSYKPLKLMRDLSVSNKIDGLQLHLALYLSAALNVSLRFVPLYQVNTIAIFVSKRAF